MKRLSLARRSIHRSQKAVDAPLGCGHRGLLPRCQSVESRLRGVNVQIYDDDWEIDNDKYELRDAGPGRGYYRDGVWIDF